MDWLIASVAKDVELPDAAMPLLEMAAESFLRAGGILSWSEWAQLGAASQTAFVKARTKIDAEQVVRIRQMLEDHEDDIAEAATEGTRDFIAGEILEDFGTTNGFGPRQIPSEDRDEV